MIEVIRDIETWRSLRRGVLKDKSLGFVPTMGALHAGHVSLFEKSVRENDLSLASIFVNPTQFNNPKDLEKYPRTFESDLMKLNAAGVDYLLYPQYEQLYSDKYRYRISENELSLGLCGAHRPGHFDGVLTVVMKLLQIAGAQRAYFGEKDYQQYLLVKEMAQAFFLNTEIIGCKTVREKDGLAMSSRNVLLDPESRARAAGFPRVLLAAESPAQAREELTKLGFEVDYIEDRSVGKAIRRFGAVRIGGVRLIDNVAR